MFRQPIVTDLNAEADLIRRWRCGRILVRGGNFLGVQRRWFVGSVSVAQVWWQLRFGHNDDDICWLDYHQPRGMPAFLTLDYLRSGKQAGYRSSNRACEVLDQISEIRGTQAIVAHVSNGRISDRVLDRLGWQQHMQQWDGRHWIKRFYDGYPSASKSIVQAA